MHIIGFYAYRCRRGSAFPRRWECIMASLPTDSLRNRSFISLIIAQFLASFNDQAIHAAAMFYAIHQGVMTERAAITILPILFFLPWALFCTTSAYFADRFSKT